MSEVNCSRFNLCLSTVVLEAEGRNSSAEPGLSMGSPGSLDLSLPGTGINGQSDSRLECN